MTDPARPPGRPAGHLDALAEAPWQAPGFWRLPGTAPARDGDWLAVDAAYGEQMALRDGLLAARLSEVAATTEGAGPGLAELLELSVDLMRKRKDFRVEADVITRPDGAVIPRDPADPLGMLGRLVQQDLCLLEKAGSGHVLRAAVVCFPANWRLAEKIGRGLPEIHAPVPDYDGDLARRVQRLFDAVKPGQPLTRTNALLYDDPALFQPVRPASASARPPYIRTERQVIFRLPRTGAVVFSIHTRILHRRALTPKQAAALGDRPLNSVADP